MASTLNKTLPGFGPIEKVRFTFTDTLLADADDVLTVAELLHGLLSMTPTAGRALTLPSAALLEASTITLAGIQVADAIPFIVRNQAALGSGFNITIVLPGDIVADSEASLVVAPQSHNEYIIRMDDVNTASPAATLFQVDSGLASAGAVPQVASTIGTIAGATVFAAVAGFELLASTTLGINGALSGITITGPNAAGSNTLTAAVAGNYKVDYTVAGQNNANATPASIALAVGINAVLPVGNSALLQLPTVGSDVDNEVSSGTACVILSLQAGDAVNMYLRAFTGYINGNSFSPSLVHLTMHLV